jgi:hypothetical protein
MVFLNATQKIEEKKKKDVTRVITNLLTLDTLWY